MLLDILFVFCKLNPDVSYRQGMHELLAPILWVVERDAVDLGQSSKAHGEDVVVRAVYSSEHIEHDAFALFSQLMHSAKNFYEQTTHSGSENPMVVRSQRILHDMLMKADPDLSRHLEAIGIVPQIFLLRWIRLLFGREFPFDDVLAMWDVLLAEDSSLELVDYVCLAMLLRIRWDLLDADYNTAIALLLRYPQPDKDHPGQSFVLDALYLRTHLSTEGGGYLVLKYTGRPMMPTDRPATPPALQRNITAFSGANAAKAAAAVASGLRPQQSARQRSNIESLMQSTAKNIYARGESLGIGKAVRGAVDEVHKRAQEIRDTQTPSLPPRASGSSPGGILGKLKSLESRNKQLAKLLDGAVGELWEYQKLVADQATTAERDGPDADLQRLSMAIAKAQFVQVYMSDPSLPLTEPVVEEEGSKEASSASERVQGEKQIGRDLQADPESDQPSQEKPTAQTPMTDLADPSTFDEGDDSASLSMQTANLAAPDPVAPALAPHTATGKDEKSSSDTKDAEGTPSRQVDRPPLAESSYSWMLGQTDSPPSSTRAVPAKTPEQNRNRGVLFGEREDIDESPTQVKRAGRARTHKVAATRVPERQAVNVGDIRPEPGPFDG